MAAYKITYIFNQGALGWSETWYIDRSTVDAAYAAAVELLPARAALCGRYTNIQAIRVGEANMRGTSVLRFQGVTPVVDLDADYAPASILVRAEAGDLYHRSVWLRGVPDAWIARNATADLLSRTLDKLNAVLLLNVDTFEAKLVALGFRLAVQGKTGTGNLPGNAVTAILDAGAPKNWTAIVCAANLPGGFDVGQNVRIVRANGTDRQKWNRRYKVIDWNGTDTVTINLPFATADALDLDDYGLLLTRIPTTIPVDRLIPLRVGIRQTGRAFFQPRGKSRGKVCTP